MAKNVTTWRERNTIRGWGFAGLVCAALVLWPLLLPGGLKLIFIPWAAAWAVILVRRALPSGRQRAAVQAEMNKVTRQRKSEAVRAEAARRMSK
jgi:hypothetical protein